MLSSETLEIRRTSHWLLRHSAEEAIPGYLVLSSLHPGTSLSDLPKEAADELGGLLQRGVQAVQAAVKPERVYVCSFNETYSPVHFHLFPRMEWMREFSTDPGDPRKLIDGGIVFSAARRAKAAPSEILAQTSEILAAVAAIRARMAASMLP